jgi:hypothetical protein
VLFNTIFHQDMRFQDIHITPASSQNSAPQPVPDRPYYPN